MARLIATDSSCDAHAGHWHGSVLHSTSSCCSALSYARRMAVKALHFLFGITIFGHAGHPGTLAVTFSTPSCSGNAEAGVLNRRAGLTSSAYPNPGLRGVIGALLQLLKHSWSATKLPSCVILIAARAEAGPLKLAVRCTPADPMLDRLLEVRMGLPWKNGNAASTALVCLPGQLPTRASLPLACKDCRSSSSLNVRWQSSNGRAGSS